MKQANSPAESAPRNTSIINNLRGVISQVYEMAAEDVDIQATFLEMGLDSISIIQVKQLIKNEYTLDVPVNRLFDDIDTLEKLASFVEATLPPVVAARANVVALPQPSANAPVVERRPAQLATPGNTDGGTSLESIINYQLQVMAKQIEALAEAQQR
ncbi:acyl carrier protein [Chryseolinea lacunae]|uniref:Acyl carrier protein n=1 Tax=Chryseolinea lacunae TaxID=2801331 RepID=A0ABS1KUC0_9BACT|nr:acyl carrier protein [Chryseolinea lacunae]MBL0743069.1 acyl carrier protein [Chryseolinea lacunae]